MWRTTRPCKRGGGSAPSDKLVRSFTLPPSSHELVHTDTRAHARPAAGGDDVPVDVDEISLRRARKRVERRAQREGRPDALRGEEIAGVVEGEARHHYGKRTVTDTYPLAMCGADEHLCHTQRR